jgi:hypothetical protein
MFRDNVPAVCVARWDLEATMYDGDIMAGPVVTLFTDDEDGARSCLVANPQRAHADLQRIMRSFFMPELITAKEAAALIKKPR